MEELFMNQKEADRYHFLEQHKKGEITLKEVAVSLRLSYVQAKRLWSKYKQYGKVGLISKARGKKSNRSFSEEFRLKVISIVREKYPDFGPTFAAEKLTEDHGIPISKEALRQLMIAAHLRVAKEDKKKLHPRRPRRSRYGDLIQMDGSDHEWFEDRAPRCVLLVATDDATSALVGLRFEKGETTQGYFRLVREYFKREGLPLALYTDKDSIFRTNHGKDNQKPTQFKRALDELGIQPICANSPQAKGRVERINGTLQDRLVKELRLKGISTIEEANAYLPIFIEKYNKRFAKAPNSSSNAHRPLCTGIDLSKILCCKHKRKLTKNLELSFEGIIYQIEEPGHKNRLVGAKVDIFELEDGTLYMEHEGQPLKFKRYYEQVVQPVTVDTKQLALVLEKYINKSAPYKPPCNHPWRSFKFGKGAKTYTSFQSPGGKGAGAAYLRT
jgi:hypothetical protein